MIVKKSEQIIDVSFWFAVLSPLIGVAVGFIGLLVFYR